MADRLSFRDLHQFYRAHLLEDVAPFWLKHAVDRTNGGLYTCIEDDGTILSEDKYLWSQCRAIWTFSALYNRIERRDEWLDLARHIYEFVSRHGRDDQGRWIFAVDKSGKPLQGATSIYADGFAMYGLTELARATGDEQVIELARETYHNVQARLAKPGSYETDPYPLPAGVKAHGVSMIFSHVFFELGQFLEDQAIIEAALHHAREVMDVYRRPDRKMLFEFMSLDNSFVDGPRGQAVVPGHAIESMWFMIHIFRALGNEQRVREAVECVRWHMELGWDEEYGGLLLGCDSEGGEPWWKFWDTKPWWPATEALYALLLCHERSGGPWCMDWYWRMHDYAFTHYPMPEHGEWTQKLDRRGNKITDVIALPVKDPFHLPRALIYCIDVLARLADRE